MKEGVVLQGAGADKCVIDGGNQYCGWPDCCVIYCESIGNCKIDGFTITYPRGAGIGVVNSSPTITNNKIINCQGEGIYWQCSHPSPLQLPPINGNTITNNSTGVYIVDVEDWPFVPNIALYSPWLNQPLDSLTQIEPGLHWNNIYGNNYFGPEANLCLTGWYLPVKDSLSGFNLPNKASLLQNYPNPFNSATVIEYQLPDLMYIRLEIYNLLGQRIRTLVNGWQGVGTHEVMWDGRDQEGQKLSSGVYFCTLRNEGLTLTKQILLVR